MYTRINICLGKSEYHNRFSRLPYVVHLLLLVQLFVGIYGIYLKFDFVSVAFKETVAETALKKLLTQFILPENCKFAQAKLVNIVVFASLSPSIKSTDIKLQENHRNIPKMTGCFVKLFPQLPNILKTSGDIKMRSWRPFRPSQIASKCLGMQPKIQYHQGRNCHYLLLAVNTRIWESFLRTPTLILFGRSQKKKDIIVCRHSNLRQSTQMLQLSKNPMKLQKKTGQPKDPWLATRAPNSTTPQVHGQS